MTTGPDHINLFNLAELTPDARAKLMTRTEADLSGFMDPAAKIIEAVRTEGDEAVARAGRDFDRASVVAEKLKAASEDFDRAFDELDNTVTGAIRFAVENIKAFHEEQRPEPMWWKETRPGVFGGERSTPIPSVACYVPRGKGAFPSVMMMTTIPAVIAGVPEIAVLTPPTPEGGIDAASLVAAKLAGIEHVYKCGGAAAVAAAAFGTATIPRCAKIVGPGSPWVVVAKKLLADRIDTGLPAGPSESIILADNSANPKIAALDLMIEAEHGPDSSAFLVTDSPDIAEAARRCIPELWSKMGEQRAGFTREVLGGPRGGIVLAPSMDEAVRFTNDYAPEHLEVLCEEPMDYLGQLHHAGEILLGENTPITLGNFVIGPNCVLPTGGHARTWSPLSVLDFTKRTSIAHVTRQGYASLASHAHRLATYEGFDAHANAVSDLRR
ncbi:MAG: histidinol dehydrogenase [Alphaproteobacteria bacterium]|nr:histidinol dehydrogenase [Alphaproteobacteria bacterium]